MTSQLEYAHEAAPNVKLYINDYNIESNNNKSQAYVQLAQSLLDQSAPLHGIGFQCHFVAGSVPEDISETAEMFTNMGLEVAFTELDIRAPVNNRGLTNQTWLDIQSVSSQWLFAGFTEDTRLIYAQSTGLLERRPGVSRQRSLPRSHQL